jgi:DNA polymerase III epsilon subunit-like protein
MLSLDNYLIVDFETTNKNPHKAEIITGTFIYTDKDFNIITVYSLNVKPRIWDKEADDAALIHGISREEANNYEDHYRAINELASWLKTLNPCHFVAHANRTIFGSFNTYDYGVLNMAMFDYSLQYILYTTCPVTSVLSTHSIAKYLKLDCDYTLDGLCKHLGIKLVNHHNSESDALATLDIAKKLIPKINKDEFLNYELYKITNNGEMDEPIKKRKKRSK